jgi:hypothetical protein
MTRRHIALTLFVGLLGAARAGAGAEPHFTYASSPALALKNMTIQFKTQPVGGLATFKVLFIQLADDAGSNPGDVA